MSTEMVRLKWLFRPSAESNAPSEEVLSVYRDYGVVPKSSRTDNFNKTPENVERYLVVRPGDLVVNRMKAWQGSLGVSDYRGIVSGDYEVLRPVGTQLDRRFAHHLLRSSHMIGEYRIRSTGIRPSQWRLYWDQMGDIPVQVPSIDEQRWIADFLDAETARIDTLIAEQERFVELLRERRRAAIALAVTRGLDPTVPLVDSGDSMLGLVPVHWKIRPLRYWVHSLDYRRIPLSSEERGDRKGSYPYYGASGVIDHIDDYLFDEPLVLVSEDGANLLLRSTPIAFIGLGKYWVNNHAHVVRPIAGPVEYWAARIEAVDVSPVVTGAAQPKLTADALMRLRIAAPEFGEREAIVAAIQERTGPTDVLIAEAERNIALSKERRAALITAAVTGQVDVSAGRAA